MLQLNLTKLVIGQKPEKQSGPKKIDRIPDGLRHIRRVKRQMMTDARQEREAIEHILKLPAEDESLHIVIDGRFQPTDIIPATRRLSHPATIQRLTISTLGFNEANIGTICRGMDQGKIGEVLIVCSHYFEKADRELYALAKKELEQRGGKIYGLRVHAKLILMEMTNGASYVVEGSGNLRSCKSIEQFTMCNDKGLLDFHRNWLTEYIATSGKA